MIRSERPPRISSPLGVASLCGQRLRRIGRTEGSVADGSGDRTAWPGVFWFSKGLLVLPLPPDEPQPATPTGSRKTTATMTCCPHLTRSRILLGTVGPSNPERLTRPISPRGGRSKQSDRGPATNQLTQSGGAGRYSALQAALSVFQRMRNTLGRSRLTSASTVHGADSTPPGSTAMPHL